jgi:hypothetical protein
MDPLKSTRLNLLKETPHWRLELIRTIRRKEIPRWRSELTWLIFGKGKRVSSHPWSFTPKSIKGGLIDLQILVMPPLGGLGVKNGF